MRRNRRKKKQRRSVGRAVYVVLLLRSAQAYYIWELLCFCVCETVRKYFFVVSTLAFPLSVPPKTCAPNGTDSGFSLTLSRSFVPSSVRLGIARFARCNKLHNTKRDIDLFSMLLHRTPPQNETKTQIYAQKKANNCVCDVCMCCESHESASARSIAKQRNSHTCNGNAYACSQINKNNNNKKRNLTHSHKQT